MDSRCKLPCLIAAALIATAAGAQDYPAKPVRVILSVPAGATPDVTARLVTPGLSNALGQPLVVDNRGGAGGLIGAEIVSKAAPDGYTIFISSPGALTILPHLRKVPYDTLKDFAPVGLISVGPFVLVTHPSLPVDSVKALIALAKAQPGKLNCASAGNGTANHLALELFKQMAGVNITHVPYKGAPQAVTDVLAGHMDMTFNSIAPIIAHIRAGRMKVLGVASAKRSAQLPEVPTVGEAGVPGFEAENWFGLFAPAQTPKRIIARLNEALVKVVRSPEIQKQFIALGAEPVGNSPEEFAAFVRRDMEKYAKVVRISGAKLD
ncbi:MAG TPA: tripartite tricarboxylate transporter substrate binding protein [Burkholderiales bacterium]|nr:tripartite tricarboxylate transporter substrate binding protein [Burkholderiales bacterium]